MRLKVKKIVGGKHHVLLLGLNNRVYATGRNKYGQLGLGHSTSQSTPTPVQCLDDKNIIDIDAGSDHSLALSKSGRLYTTGQNSDGQLGVGDNNNRNIFTPASSGIEVKEIISIAAGATHTLVMYKENNLVYATGNNRSGQLGIEDNESKNSFTCVQTLYFKNVSKIFTSFNSYSSFALDKAGDIYRTGNNRCGQLGSGNKQSTNGFKKITNLPKIRTVLPTTHRTFVIDKFGKIFGTGRNDSNILSSQRVDEIFFFQPVQDIKDVFPASSHIFVKKEDENIYAIGNNDYSRLGIGSDKDYEDSLILVKSLRGKNIKKIVFTGASNFAIASNGQVYVSGYNKSGLFGLGHEDEYTEFKLNDKLLYLGSFEDLYKQEKINFISKRYSIMDSPFVKE